MTDPTWRTPAELGSGWMVIHAKDRGIIKLDDGRTARLVCWRPKGNQQRIEFPGGARRTVKKHTIQYALIEPEAVTDTRSISGTISGETTAPAAASTADHGAYHTETMEVPE